MVEAEVNAIAIVCTRSDSRRLPGKAMKKIAGVPALCHIIRRLKRTGLKIVLAMPEHDAFDIPGDDLKDVAIYRGEDLSPLHRLAGVLKIYDSAEYIVRVTHDDILIDANTILDLVEAAAGARAGYATSPGIIEGAGVEVIHRDNILHAAARRKEPTEFVSYFVRGDSCPRKGWFKLAPRESITRPYRLTLDFEEDALVLESVLRVLGPDSDLDSVARYIDANPQLREVNALPDLSIYTCAYNAQDTIIEAIKSVDGIQSLYSCEHVILDDASRDETLTKASRYYEYNFTHPKRILYNDSNLGLASSCNRALSECKGKYVMRLDADDEILPQEFARESPFIFDKLSAGFQVVYPAYLRGHDYWDAKPEDPRNHHHAGGAIFDRAFLNELRFRDGLRHWDGKELHKRLLEVGANIAYHERPIWFYRDRPNSMSKSDPHERQRILKEIEQ